MNVYSMPGVSEMGMVWMGANQTNNEMPIELMQNDQSDLLLEHESPYFTPSLQSISSHCIDGIQGSHSSQMDAMENLDIMQYMQMKHEENDATYQEDDMSQASYMITASTQTVPCPAKKIKPIRHPGLVLKTPIAYHSNTDPAVIPIQKDGIAVCEKCGAIGVKHAFYTRERRFCSMACARSYSGLIPEQVPVNNASSPTPALLTPPTPQQPQQQEQDQQQQEQQQQQQQNYTSSDNNDMYAKHRFVLKAESNFDTDDIVEQDLPQLFLPEIPAELPPPPIRKNSHNWDTQFADPNFVAASVTCFKHAPMSDIWDNIMIGMKVEVENTDCDSVCDTFPNSFWVAAVLKIVGYKALLRYEGFGSNSNKDFWVSLCSHQVHPVGWCATRGKPLIPPKTIQNKFSDWKDFLSKRLTGARTLPSNLSAKINESLKSRFECGLCLEVVDKNRISQVKVAVVHKIVGKRLNVKYCDLPVDDAGFWCHEDSPLLHPVGWASKVGHHLVAPMNYIERITQQGNLNDDDATDELFTSAQVGNPELMVDSGFVIGMKLEAIDPLNLSSICVATVINVLCYGYIMIRIDTYESDATGADWFCYHVKSPCIFPVGFCERNGIPLTPPKGYDPNTFSWRKYLSETNNIAAPQHLFNTSIPGHGFACGQKIEAADLMDPRLVCVATVAKVAGRLLRVHFDGWEEEYDQWLDCESPDIYPVGWCQSIGHKLEGPPQMVKPVSVTNKVQKAGRKKGRKKKGKDQPVGQKATRAASVSSEFSKTDDLDSDGNAFSMDSSQLIVKDESNVPTQQQHSADSNEKNVNKLDNTGLTISDHNVTAPVDQKPPWERKVTSYISTSGNTNPKTIPRLIDSTGTGNETGDIYPEEWNVFDVAQFLRVNDCANYCDSFSKQKIDGKILMALSKEDILQYTGGKVGPSLKIFDLIQQLQIKINPNQSRHSKTNIKKSL